MSSLTVHWQPIVDLVSGQVVGYEALGRVSGRESEGFAAVAETARKASGMRATLLHLQELAVARLGRQPLGTLLFVNVRLGLMSALSDSLNEVPFPRYASLVLEVPESGGRLATWEAQLASMRTQGVRVAIDDWGIGSADPLRLVRLKPDWIKLDVALTSQIGTRVEADRLVQMLVRWTDPSQTRVIAEGVERPEQVWRLRELGVRYGQGFGLRRPSRRWAARVRMPARTHRVRDLPPAMLALAEVVGLTTNDLGLLAKHQGRLAEVAQEAARHTAEWIAAHAMSNPVYVYASPERLAHVMGQHVGRLLRGELTSEDAAALQRIAAQHLQLNVSWASYALAHRELTASVARQLRRSGPAALAEVARHVLAWDEAATLHFLQTLAEEDPSSRVLSRAVFTLRASAELERRYRQGAPATVVSIHLASLSRLDFAASDQVAEAVGRALRPLLEQGWWVGRWDSSHFVALAPGAVREGPEDCRKLVARVVSDALDGGRPVLGVAQLGVDGVNLEGLLLRAQRRT
jgi:EAL domain-containing protein (putative c-di-GMP-specific phosphodiesterase class I)/GGDEF domain-containing protein